MLETFLMSSRINYQELKSKCKDNKQIILKVRMNHNKMKKKPCLHFSAQISSCFLSESITAFEKQQFGLLLLPHIPF